MNKKYDGEHRTVDSLASQLDQLSDGGIEIPKELSERQRRIVKYRLRGLTQTAIAQLEKISQPMVAKEMRQIRKVFAEQGKSIDQNEVVGETVHLYQEIEREAWSLYYNSKQAKKSGDANRALNTVMNAREKSINLLLDLGILERASVQHQHNVNLPPFMKKWQESPKEDKRIVVEKVIDTQLEELEEPEPPQLPENIEIEPEDSNNE